jgi:hypothetical protein
MRRLQVLPWYHSSQSLSERRRHSLGGEYHNEYDDQQHRNFPVLKEVHGGEQLKSDATGADETQNERRTNILI